MLNKLIKRINVLKERSNVRKRLLTDAEFLENYADLLIKEEKQMYARLYRGD